MKKRRFPATMEVTTADLNGIGDDAETGVADLVHAVANLNAESGVIFNDSIPTVGSGPPWTVTLPTQYFAIDGIVGKLTGTTFVLAAGARTAAVFLRLRRTDVTATRPFLNTSGSGPVSGSASFVNQQGWQASYVVVDPYTGSGDDPVAGATDVGAPIKLAAFVITGAPAISVTKDPDNRLWSIPAGMPSTHASRHLSGGADPIQLATPSQDGLMSASFASWVTAALTSLSVSAGSEFLVITTAAGPPKTATLALRLGQALKKVTESGVDKLGLNFPSGPLAGASARPARADHKHALSDSPVQLVTQTIVVTSAAQLGQLFSVAVPTSIAAVTDVSCYWVAPTLASNYPRMSAEWSTVLFGGANKRVGCRHVLVGPRDLRIRLGDDALCELTTQEFEIAFTAAGSQTWDAVGGTSGTMPTTGTIVVNVTGTRA